MDRAQTLELSLAATVKCCVSANHLASEEMGQEVAIDDGQCAVPQLNKVGTHELGRFSKFH
jgi:hypothetical protein